MTPARHSQIVVAAALVAIAMVTVSSPQARATDSRDKMRQEAARQSAKAAKALDAIMQVPDKAIPRDLLARAKAVAVFPHVIKVAFTVGGEGGRGVVSQRIGAGWDRPVFLRAGGASIGPQIGALSTDFFLLLMNDDTVAALMRDRFELGGDVGVAAGPIGREAGAGTDVLMQAGVLSYSRSRGLFAGVDVKGIVLRPEDELNLAVYNRTAKELLKEPTGGDATTASEPDVFPRALSRYAGKS